MPSRPCTTCGSTDTSLVIAVSLDWPHMRKARLDCAHTCETCNAKEDLELLAAQLTTAFGPQLARLERHLAAGNYRSADRATTKLMRSIAKVIPDLHADLAA